MTVPAAALGAAAAVWAWLALPPWLVPAGCVLGWSLLAMSLIDAREHRLPDVLTLPLIPAGLAVTWWEVPDDAVLLDHALAAVLGYSAFALLAAGYRRLRGRDGLGLGDAKLLAAAGAWVGLAGLPSVVLLAALSGLAVTLVRGWVTGAAVHGVPLAFGPYLALAFWVVWLHGAVA
ncbi:MAG TPA: A24 family peptidase [Azospirillum sp.]|nr:A24 family peptidase [Azospirillum sp.]